MRATNKAKSQGKLVSVTVGGLSRETVKALREDAKQNHRSLAGHIRAILELAMANGGAQ
jgi:hypothetical protein